MSRSCRKNRRLVYRTFRARRTRRSEGRHIGLNEASNWCVPSAKPQRQSRWFKNRERPDEPVCMACYNRQLAATRGKCCKCGKDGKDTSGMHKSKHNEGEWICDRCAHRELPFDGCTCDACGRGASDGVRSWSRSKLKNRPWLCVSCYVKERLILAEAEGTKCLECGTDTTSHWHNSKLVPGAKICQACYRKESLSKAKAAGMTCGECGTDTTSVWHNSKLVPGAKICGACYTKARRGKKKAERSRES